MALEMDFVADASIALAARLRQLGYDIPSDISLEEARVAYFNVRHRLVTKRPRRLHGAPDLRAPAGHEAGLSLVTSKIAEGADLRPHLSRRIARSSWSDGLLNDWGIHHFHLGTRVERDGFVARTEHVLFARLEQDDAYLVDVLRHDTFTEVGLLKTLHAHWPEVLAPYLLVAAGGLDQAVEPTNEVVEHVRRANANVFHELAPGKIYCSPGGGYTTDGTPLSAAFGSTRLVKEMRHQELDLRSRELELRATHVRSGQLALPDPCSIVLTWQGDGALVAVLDGSLRIPVGDLPRL